MFDLKDISRAVTYRRKKITPDSPTTLEEAAEKLEDFRNAHFGKQHGFNSIFTFCFRNLKTYNRL